MARVLQQGGVRWYRDSQRPGIRMMQTDSRTRPAEQFAELMLETAKIEGRELTPELVGVIEALALKQEAQMRVEIRARGVPDGIRQLLRANKKKQALKALREITLTDRDLNDFIYNCDVVGLLHWDKFLDFVPEQRRPRRQRPVRPDAASARLS